MTGGSLFPISGPLGLRPPLVTAMGSLSCGERPDRVAVELLETDDRVIARTGSASRSAWKRLRTGRRPGRG